MTPEPFQPLRFLPLGVDLRGRSCLVVGGGAVGSHKVDVLIRAGAVVTVVAPRLSDALAARVETGAVRWIEEAYHADHVSGAALVVAATGDAATNASVVADARRAGALACDASSAEASQVIFGALLPSDGTTIAVFSDGRDPARARRTRDHLAALIEQDRKGS